MKITWRLDGIPVSTEITADTLLLDLIRSMGFTGTKEGCGVGVCGACTVLVNDLPVSSCLYLAGCVHEADVWTVEGLAKSDPALIESFVKYEGVQCGICTPGQVVAAAALAKERPAATEDEVQAYLAGNLCRCTGYKTIVSAVEAYLGRK